MTTALLALVLAASAPVATLAPAAVAVAVTPAAPALASASVTPLPNAPKPQPRIDRTEWTLLAADAAVRGLDAYSTRRCLAGPNHELVLPDLISHSTPGMVAFSEGMVGVQYLLARELGPRHRRLAHLATLIDIGVDAPAAVHNLFLKGGGRKP